jgi:hypothetical protein
MCVRIYLFSLSTYFIYVYLCMNIWLNTNTYFTGNLFPICHSSFSFFHIKYHTVTFKAKASLISILLYLCACIHIRMYIYMYIYIYIYTYIYIYIYLCIHFISSFIVLLPTMILSETCKHDHLSLLFIGHLFLIIIDIFLYLCLFGWSIWKYMAHIF